MVDTKFDATHAFFVKIFCLDPLKTNMEHNHSGLEYHVPF